MSAAKVRFVMNTGEKMTKTKKRPQLKPLKVGEVVEFPCGATLTIRTSTRTIHTDKGGLYVVNLADTNGIDYGTSEQVTIAIYGDSIPLLIKTLRRAQKTK